MSDEPLGCRRKKMSKSAAALVKVCRTVSLIVALVLALSWTTVAYAQVPADAQYDSPTARASGNPAIGNPSGNPASMKAGGGAVSGGASEGIGAGGIGGSIGKMLPFTGGELSLPLIALSTLVLGSSIVLLVFAVRRVIELFGDWRHANGTKR